MSAASSITPIDPSSVTLDCFALLGNPNIGKTTLFNRLCGLRAKTANFPGSTVEARIGTVEMKRGSESLSLVDLPGLYSLNLDRPESTLCRDYLTGKASIGREARAALIVVDATNLSRNLALVNQVLQLGLPCVVALNMIDLAQRRGLTIDHEQLAEYLGVPVVPVCARSGDGLDRLREALPRAVVSTVALPNPNDRSAVGRWADGVVEQSVGGHHAVGTQRDTVTDRLDAAFTHPVLGVLVFAAVMIGLFYVIFTLSSVPMDLIDLLFATLGGWVDVGFEWLRDSVGWNLVDGPLHHLLVDGVIGGVAGTLVFLPQICLLFFLISLLEDTGYLARASFVMDRLLRRFGLPGQAFVPMLSAHACAIPAIMSARLIPDHRDRIATILVLPFLSCSARLPVYVLLISVLFGHSPWLAGLAFAGCYLLGAGAALLVAMVARRTILRGPSRPMVLELPSYKRPSIRTALLTTFDRAMTFLRKAGTVIVAICIVLWWLGAYPTTGPSPEADALRSKAAEVQSASPDEAEAIIAEAKAIDRRHAKQRSFIGRIGHAVEPVFRPMGGDWQLSIGLLSSFLAREVFVSTMAVVITGEEDSEAPTVQEQIIGAARADGTPLFTVPTSASLLVFYVLAMQCLPTLAVTRRETGSWWWAIAQLAIMTGMAYAAALITYQGLIMMGVT